MAHAERKPEESVPALVSHDHSPDDQTITDQDILVAWTHDPSESTRVGRVLPQVQSLDRLGRMGYAW